MTTLTTRRSWTLSGPVLVAFVAYAAARGAPPEVSTAVPVRSAGALGSMRLLAARPPPLKFAVARGFYQTQLAPRMFAETREDDAVTGAPLGDPASRRWANDPAVVDLVERRTIRSITDAFKNYAIEQLGIDRWSIPVVGRGGGASVAGASPPIRFHFGVSRQGPRADVVIPAAAGRFALGVDARGDLRASFDTNSSRFQLSTDVNVPEHTAAVGLSVRY